LGCGVWAVHKDSAHQHSGDDRFRPLHARAQELTAALEDPFIFLGLVFQEFFNFSHG
jgi:hypothetical protein